MTEKITEPQRQLLESAAGRPITDAAAVDRSVSLALIKKKLVLWLPAKGEGSRLIVTQTGLAALAAANAKKRRTTPGSPPARRRGGVEARVSLAAVRGNTIRSPADGAQEGRGRTLAPESQLPKGKLGALAALLTRPEGASVQEMIVATGWQAHSVRGAMSGALKKRLGFVIESERAAAGRVYRIIDGGAPSTDQTTARCDHGVDRRPAARRRR